jgi:hypothetical protein
MTDKELLIQLIYTYVRTSNHDCKLHFIFNVFSEYPQSDIFDAINYLISKRLVFECTDKDNGAQKLAGIG